MKKKIAIYLKSQYEWFKKNLEKLTFLIVVHFILIYLLNLPYINLLKILFAFLPYLVDWVVILLLFRPKKDFILKSALVIFLVSIIPGILSIAPVLEFFGNVCYMLVTTYIIYSLGEVRKK